MQLSMRAKTLMLIASGVAAFVVFSPAPTGGVVASVDRRDPTRGLPSASARHLTQQASANLTASPMPSAGESLRRLDHRVAEAPDGATLFAAHSWYVAPPPPPPPPPAPVTLAPPVPTAPPLPFAFLGRYRADNGAAVYYVTRADRVYDLKAGDVVDGTYRFDGEQGNQLVFTYQPLNAQQLLPIDVK